MRAAAISWHEQFSRHCEARRARRGNLVASQQGDEIASLRSQ
jgi:hypothetical protein